MSLNVSANLFLNAYGMKPLNVSLDLCNILDGILCPLPKYNFIGEDSIKLPSSVDVTSNLPGIAYAVRWLLFTCRYDDTHGMITDS